MARIPSKKHITESIIVREDVAFVTSVLSISIDALHTSKEESLRAIYVEMLQSGSQGYTREEIMHVLNLHGASLSVSTENTCIHISLKARNEVLGKILPILTTMLTAPTWNPKELSRVKEYIVNQLALQREEARIRATDAFVNSFVPIEDWRFNFSIDAYIKSIQGIHIEDLKAFHRKLSMGTWTHTVGGTTQACSKLSKTIALLPSRTLEELPQIQNTYPVIEPSHTVLTLINIPHKQNIEFSIGGALPFLITDSAYVPMYFGISVLGLYGGFTGRLMSTVREKDGLTYMIYSRIEDMTTTTQGYWRISTFFAPQDTERGISAVLREIELLKNQGISEDELRRFKAILNTRNILAQDSLVRMVADRHTRTLSGVTEEMYEAMRMKIQNLTATEVNSTLSLYLNLQSLVVSGAGPVSSVERQLKKRYKG